MTIDSDTRWYVAQTQPHAENKAMAHLQRQGFAAYLPRYLKRRRHARRVETVSAPLFPRYLFVAVDIETQRWRSIYSTVGVSRLVCRGDEPAAVAPGIVEALRQRQDAAGFINLEQETFAPGDSVRVLQGAFADCLGLYESISDVQRVAILLDLLGRKVRVMLKADWVEAA